MDPVKGPEKPVRVATVIPCMGNALLTRECLQSLLRDGTDFRGIVVVENGTSENTTQLTPEFPGVRFDRLPENEGFAGGVNRGLDQARSSWDPEFYFILNNDATVEKGAIGSLVKFMEDHPECGIAAPKILADPEKKILWAAGGEFIAWRFLARNRGQGMKDNGIYSDPRECTFLSGCALMIRRDVIESVGLLDERFFTYAEDLDYCLRAIARGWKLLYVPQAIVYHEGSATSGGEYEPFQSFYRWRNRFLIASKHAGWAQKIFLFSCFFPVLILRDMLTYFRKRKVRSILYLWTGFFQFIKMSVLGMRPRPMRSLAGEN